MHVNQDGAKAIRNSGTQCAGSPKVTRDEPSRLYASGELGVHLSQEAAYACGSLGREVRVLPEVSDDLVDGLS